MNFRKKIMRILGMEYFWSIEKQWIRHTYIDPYSEEEFDNTINKLRKVFLEDDTTNK